MAKKKQSSMVRGHTCSCNPGRAVLGGVVASIGLLIAVQGFALQLGLGGSWVTGTMAWILGYYIIGVVLIGAGKHMAASYLRGCKEYD